MVIDDARMPCAMTETIDHTPSPPARLRDPCACVRGLALLLAPAGTPNTIIARLNGEAGEEFGAFFRAEIAKWTDVVREAGIRAE